MSSSSYSLPAQPVRKLLLWVPTVAWLCVIAAFSTDLFSARHTGSILWKILHWFHPGISRQTFNTIHFLVRKSAHFCTYGLLSMFAFFSWRGTLPRATRWSPRWCALALVLTFLAASLDEFHQTFIPSRTGTFHDVVLDLAGAVFFQLVLALVLSRSRLPDD